MLSTLLAAGKNIKERLGRIKIRVNRPGKSVSWSPIVF